MAKEPTQVKIYKLPQNLAKVLGEAKVSAIEILDDILFQSVGVHLIEG